MPGLDSRVERLEDAVAPDACCRATVWYHECEPQKAAVQRLGRIGPEDVVILLANWTPCPRPGRHRHHDAEVLVTPRHR